MVDGTLQGALSICLCCRLHFRLWSAFGKGPSCGLWYASQRRYPAQKFLKLVLQIQSKDWQRTGGGAAIGLGWQSNAVLKDCMNAPATGFNGSICRPGKCAMQMARPQKYGCLSIAIYDWVFDMDMRPRKPFVTFCLL